MNEASLLVRILIAILVAALVYWICLALGLPAVVGVIAAILVLLVAVGAFGNLRGPRV